jgi:RecT family
MSDTRERERASLIDQKLDGERLGELAITGKLPGEMVGVQFTTMLEVMEFAKLMSLADSGVPPHLRNKPGNCLAVLTKAIRLRMDPFELAEVSYEVEQKGVRRIAWESAFYNAVVVSRAPTTTQPFFEIVGEGDERRCKVWATIKGETEPRVYISETLGKLRPRRNEVGAIKGSPLWDTKPELQLMYNAIRDFARLYFRHVIMGIMTVDELEDHGAVRVHDVTPNPTFPTDEIPLRQRLRPRETDEGFNQSTVADTMNQAIEAAREPEAEIIEPEKKPRRKGGAVTADATVDPSAVEQSAGASTHVPADAPAGDDNGQKKLI